MLPFADKKCLLTFAGLEIGVRALLDVKAGAVAEPRPFAEDRICLSTVQTKLESANG
jgi:hypothetical protein